MKPYLHSYMPSWRVWEQPNLSPTSHFVLSPLIGKQGRLLLLLGKFLGYYTDY